MNRNTLLLIELKLVEGKMKYFETELILISETDKIYTCHDGKGRFYSFGKDKIGVKKDNTPKNTYLHVYTQAKYLERERKRVNTYIKRLKEKMNKQ